VVAIAFRAIAKASAVGDVREQVSLADSARAIARGRVGCERRKDDEVTDANRDWHDLVRVDVASEEAVVCAVMMKRSLTMDARHDRQAAVGRRHVLERNSNCDVRLRALEVVVVVPLPRRGGGGTVAKWRPCRRARVRLGETDA